MRLRPILMTTGAMVLGAVPLALATGPGGEARNDIGWVIVGGMTVGTLFTLFVVPTVYTTCTPRAASGRAAARRNGARRAHACSPVEARAGTECPARCAARARGCGPTPEEKTVVRKPRSNNACRTLRDRAQSRTTAAVDGAALTQASLERIGVDRSGPALNTVIELNPDALADAERLDAERRAGTLRGPLHGIPCW